MTFLQAIVLGVVQGLTEFLPISSTAHLRIVPALVGWKFHYGNTTTNDPGAPFTAVIQLGTTLAIVLYFWRELLHVTVAWVRGIYDKSVRGSLEYRLGWYLIFATVPVGVFGLVFSKQIETGARNLWLIASALIGLAVGADSAIATAYIAEFAPKKRRGALAMLQQWMITVGILASFR